MEKKYSFRFVLIMMLVASVVAFLVAALVVTCLFVFGGFLNSMGKSMYVRDYTALLEMIDSLYIGEYSKDNITAFAMKAAVESLNDGWSYYLTPEELAYFIDDSNNQYIGIGVSVVGDEATGGLCVDYVYPDSPAEVAGVAAGDVIVAIDGKTIAGKAHDDMLDLLTRDIGDSVELTVQRADGSTAVIAVEYGYVFLNPVSFELLHNDIGYVRIRNFDQGSADNFIKAVTDLIGQGAKALVFDVRDNGGGRVTEMTDMLDYLLPEGEIFIEVDRTGAETVIESDPDMVDIPCAVLVDHFSFSAAEYFAATLSEYDYAIVVGERTTGKSRVQTTYSMPGGGALHISTRNYLTRNRVDLHEAGGLAPDYEVVLTEDEFYLLVSGNLEKDADPQLAKALELLAS